MSKYADLGIDPKRSWKFIHPRDADVLCANPNTHWIEDLVINDVIELDGQVYIQTNSAPKEKA